MQIGQKKMKFLSETDTESDFEPETLKKPEVCQKRTPQKLGKRTKSSTSTSRQIIKSSTVSKSKSGERKCPLENCDSLGNC